MSETFNINDLRKVYSENNASLHEIELCYSRNPVLIKPLKIKDKKELLKSIESKNESAVNRMLDTIIDKYVEYKNGDSINSMELTSQERQQIMVNIRLASVVKDTIKIVHSCPSCEHVNKNIPYNVNDIVVDFYEKDDDSKDYIEVANETVKIFLKPMSRRKEIEIENIIKKRKYKTDSEKYFTMIAGVIDKIVARIDDVESEVSLTTEEIINFFDNLASSELNKITEYFENINFGVKLPLDFKCEKCGYENDEEVVHATVFFIS